MSITHKRPIGADIWLPFILIALVFGGLFWQKYYEARQISNIPSKTAGELSTRKVLLFFVDEDSNLSREAREIEATGDRTAFIKAILDELFTGSVGNLDSVIPEWADINNVRIENNVAIIDLGKDFSDSLPPGSSSEMLAVYAIVNTVCINIPDVRHVKITLDGNPDSHLRHLELSEPLEPDYSLEKQPATQSQQEPKQRIP